MNGFDCSVHYMTLRQVGYDESNTAVTFYHDRTHFDQTQRNLYAQFTEDFYLQQGRHFVLHNRIATTPNKISKLKDQVKELDSLFQTNNLEKVSSSGSSSSANEILNSFFASFGSSLSKIIWLCPSRILMIMQDATLVWLVIDTISGNIVKILTDKTLTQPFGHNSQKLSGSFVCDVALVYKGGQNFSPILVIAYLDKSKIDLITFGKAMQVNEYLNFENGDKSSRTANTNVEKLASFDPSSISYEFSCPSLYLIEKRIAINYHAQSALTSPPCTFCLWWPNDGHQAFVIHNKPQQHTISLLERDDLRSNVLILSTCLTDKNLLEYIFKSDGHLLSLNYIDANSFLAVEQTETNAHKYLLLIYKYEIPVECEKSGLMPQQATECAKPKSPKIKLISFHMNAKVQSIEQVKYGKRFLVILCQDQTVVLYDMSRNLVFNHRFVISLASNNSNL